MAWMPTYFAYRSDGHQPCIFLAGLERAERGIAARLVRLAQGSPPWPAIAAGPAIAQAERHVSMILAASTGSTASRCERSSPSCGRAPGPWRWPLRPAGPPGG